MASNTTINIAIVNWNSSAALRMCVESINKSDHKALRIVIVDNGSTPSEILALRAIADEFRTLPIYIVNNSENLGYAGGNNAAYRFIAEHQLDGNLLILNPDTQLTANTLSVMNSSLRDGVGIVTPRLLSPSGKVLLDFVRMSGYRQKNRTTDHDLEVLTDFSQGTCMLLSRSMIEKVGLFDERFFLYWEEVDLSLRARLAGYRLISSTKTHVVKAANPPSRLPACFYYSVRNAFLMRKKFPSFFSASGYALYVVRVTGLTLKMGIHPKLFISALMSVADGLRDAIGGRYGPKEVG